MFEPGREAHDAVRDAELRTRLRGEPLMRGRRRVGYQALCVTQIIRDAHELERVEEAERTRLAAGNLESDKGRAAAHLPAHNVGLRVIGPARIDQPRDLGMAG